MRGLFSLVFVAHLWNGSAARRNGHVDYNDNVVATGIERHDQLESNATSERRCEIYGPPGSGLSWTFATPGSIRGACRTECVSTVFRPKEITAVFTSTFKPRRLRSKSNKQGYCSCEVGGERRLLLKLTGRSLQECDANNQRGKEACWRAYSVLLRLATKRNIWKASASACQACDAAAGECDSVEMSQAFNAEQIEELIEQAEQGDEEAQEVIQTLEDSSLSDVALVDQQDEAAADAEDLSESEEEVHANDDSSDTADEAPGDLGEDDAVQDGPVQASDGKEEDAVDDVGIEDEPSAETEATTTAGSELPEPSSNGVSVSAELQHLVPVASETLHFSGEGGQFSSEGTHFSSGPHFSSEGPQSELPVPAKPETVVPAKPQPSVNPVAQAGDPLWCREWQDMFGQAAATCRDEHKGQFFRRAARPSGKKLKRLRSEVHRMAIDGWCCWPPMPRFNPTGPCAQIKCYYPDGNFCDQDQTCPKQYTVSMKASDVIKELPGQNCTGEYVSRQEERARASTC